jgi:hypothetical protein
MRVKVMSVMLAAGLVLFVAARPRAQAPTGPPATAPAAGERKLDLTFDGEGYVTLIARNVTIKDILAEWTRKGGTQFVYTNGQLGSGLTSLQFEHRPESEVILSLLRASTFGRVLVPRLEGTTGVSRLGVVSILVTSNPSSSGMYAGPATTQQYPDSPDNGELPPVSPPPGAVSAPGQAQPQPGRATMPGVYNPPSGPGVPVTPVPAGGRGGDPAFPGTGRGGGA